MKFSFAHNNINVKDLDKSLAFYKEALLLEESRRLEDPSGAFILVYLKSLIRHMSLNSHGCAIGIALII